MTTGTGLNRMEPKTTQQETSQKPSKRRRRELLTVEATGRTDDNSSRAVQSSQLPAPTPFTTNEIDDKRQQLIRKSPSQMRQFGNTTLILSGYVNSRVAREPEDCKADYIPTEKACRLLFSKILVGHESNNLFKNAFADFLDVLSSVESYRVLIAQEAETALHWNKYWSGEDPKQVFPDKKVEELELIVKDQNTWRTVYMKIVKKTILLVCNTLTLP